MGKIRQYSALPLGNGFGCDRDVWVSVNDSEADIVFSFYPAVCCVDYMLIVFS